jgi:hypothetical protein
LRIDRCSSRNAFAWAGSAFSIANVAVFLDDYFSRHDALEELLLERVVPAEIIVEEHRHIRDRFERARREPLLPDGARGVVELPHRSEGDRMLVLQDDQGICRARLPVGGVVGQRLIWFGAGHGLGFPI